MKKTTANDGKEASPGVRTETGEENPEVHAVECLRKLVGEIKDRKTPLDIMAQYYTIYGFVSCCLQCGFVTEEKAEELMKIVETMIEDAIQKTRKIRFSS